MARKHAGQCLCDVLLSLLLDQQPHHALQLCFAAGRVLQDLRLCLLLQQTA